MTTTLDPAVEATSVDGGRRPKVVYIVLVAIVFVVVPLLLWFTGVITGPMVRRPGDVVVRTELFEFSERQLDVEAGRVSVFLENEDATHHDFTVNGVVQIDAPGHGVGRSVFEIDRGNYRFYCSLHPDMEGTLTVS